MSPRPSPPRAFPRLLPLRGGCGQLLPERSVYTGRAGRGKSPVSPLFPGHETDLSAKRTPAEAQARLPRAHVDACRPHDPQAPPRQGAQAPVGLGPAGRRSVQRKNRLSRSRDFDAVYRHGRSVSTRFLTLYWFAREDEPGDPRLGLAVPKAAGNAVVRNRIKRQLREIWRAKLDAETRPGDERLRARRARRACPRRPRRAATSGSPSASTRCSGRWPRERQSAAARAPACARHRARLRLPLDARRVRPEGTCKYHPSCSQYAIDALRKYGLVQGLAQGGLAAAALQPVVARRSGPRMIVATLHRLDQQLLQPLEDAVRWLLDRFHYNVGLPWAWAIVGDDDRRADLPRAADGASRSTRCRRCRRTRRR